MINVWESFINGLISGLGMVIVMTVFSVLSFFVLKKWIVKSISDIWVKVKEEGLKLDGYKFDGKLKKIDDKNE